MSKPMKRGVSQKGLPARIKAAIWSASILAIARTFRELPDMRLNEDYISSISIRLLKVELSLST